MAERLIAHNVAPEGFRALLGVHGYLRSCGIEHSLLDLVDLRASQLNGCAYCTDMHWKELRAGGASEQKLALLTCWRGAPGFTQRERAALAWCEVITLIAQDQVPDDVYQLAREQFSEANL